MRITPLTEPFEAATGELLTAMMPAGVAPIALFRTFAKNHELARSMHQGQGSYLLSRRFTVDMRIREIVIDRVCARCGCEYEFGVHAVYFADRVGLTSTISGPWCGVELTTIAGPSRGSVRPSCS